MFTKLRIIGVLSVLFFTLASAWASPVEGVVNDAHGQPLKGAEVRIETQDGKIIGKTNTDARGYYLSANFPAGTYKVDLVVASVMKASIKNVPMKAGKPAQLNFDLKAESVVKTGAKRDKHYVWMPPTTGTHMGGRWVEVNDDGTSASGDRTQKVDAKVLQRATQGLGGGGGGTP
jgi:hypothetical protein